MSERPEVPSGYGWRDVEVAGGRRLEVLTGGPDDGFPVVFHSGTPSGAVPFPVVVDAAAARGLRAISYSRPGYGWSSAAPGRTVADAAADTAALLDALGHGRSDRLDGRFATFGWSGGGPHALACAGVLADRCVAAAVIAGVAPADAEGLDWTAGMGEENLVEFELARKGGEEFEALLQLMSDAMTTVTEPATVIEALGDLVSEQDKLAIEDKAMGDYLVAAMQQAVLEGTAGWRDDDLAMLRGWGFELAAVESPLTIWQGTEDRMVPLAHGKWLGQHLPSARLEVLKGEGHISIVPLVMGRLLEDLATEAGLKG